MAQRLKSCALKSPASLEGRHISCSHPNVDGEGGKMTLRQTKRAHNHTPPRFAMKRARAAPISEGPSEEQRRQEASGRRRDAAGGREGAAGGSERRSQAGEESVGESALRSLGGRARGRGLSEALRPPKARR